MRFKFLNSSEVLFDNSSAIQCASAIQGQTWTRSVTDIIWLYSARDPTTTFYSLLYSLYTFKYGKKELN